MHASERYARMRLHVQTRKPVHTDIRLKCRSVLQLFLADRLEVHGTMLSMLFDFGNTRFPRHPRRSNMDRSAPPPSVDKLVNVSLSHLVQCEMVCTSSTIAPVPIV